MRIKSRLHIITWSALFSMLLVAIIIAAGERLYDRSLRQMDMMTNGFRLVFNLSTLTHDLLENPTSQRAQTQWTTTYINYKRFVDQISETIGQNDEKLQRIIHANTQLEHFYKKLLSSTAQPEADTLSQTDRERMSLQENLMMEEMQLVAAVTSQLHHEIQKRHVLTHGNINRLMLITVAVATILVTIFSWILGRGIHRSISSMKEGTRKLAAGKLDTELAMTGNDELADLANDFNVMTNRLNTTLASRDALNHEIERRRQTEKTLRRSEATSRSLLDSTAEGIIGVDHSNIITFANPAAARLLGYGSDEMLGHSVHDLVHHSYNDGSPYPPESCPMSQSLTTGVAQQVDDEFLWRKDGSGFPVTYNCSPIVKNKQALGAVIAFTDITDLKRVEKKLAEAKTAELANELKRSFLSNVSHEFRTPLNIIMGMEHILSRENVTSQQRKCIEKIGQAGQRLTGLIDGLFDFTRLDGGKIDLELQPIDLHQLLCDVAAKMDIAAKNKGLKLIVDVDRDQRSVFLVDDKRLGETLNYLVDNAIKFTQGGSVRLILRTTPQIDESHRVVITVKDTGIGMSRHLTPLAQHDFVQADQSTAKTHGGIGLGLTLSRYIIHLMGGSLAIKSEVGKGTAVTVELLLKKSAADAENIEDPGHPIVNGDAEPEQTVEAVIADRELTEEQTRDLRSLLVKLSETITMDYPNGLNLFRSMEERYQNSKYADALAAISLQLDSFETEEIVASCDNLIKELEKRVQTVDTD